MVVQGTQDLTGSGTFLLRSHSLPRVDGTLDLAHVSMILLSSLSSPLSGSNSAINHLLVKIVKLLRGSISDCVGNLPHSADVS